MSGCLGCLGLIFLFILVWIFCNVVFGIALFGAAL